VITQVWRFRTADSNSSYEKNQTGSILGLIFGTGFESGNGIYIFEQPDLDSQFQVSVWNLEPELELVFSKEKKRLKMKTRTKS
jgi:hypothetical protein